MNRRAVAALCVLPLGMLGAYGCGQGDLMSSRSGGGAGEPAPSVSASESAFELTPRVEPVGLGDIHDMLRITRLDFEAEIYVLPDGMEAIPAQAAIRFSFADGVARTDLRGDALRLMRGGTYQVLVRVRPRGDGSSVVLGGEYLAPDDALEKPDEEPAPIPADEPAPIPADEPAPIPADDDDDDEPAPIPADEPAPIPADEPAPIPADESGDEPPSAEPAPIPADRGDDDDDDDDAREKPEGFDAGETVESGEPVFVRSSRPFEFYAGTVEVSAGARELVVTWDVRNWLRALLAEPLGLPTDAVIEDANGTGFRDVPTDFNVRAR